jgi:iron complex transport system substrate-binding protein
MSSRTSRLVLLLLFLFFSCTPRKPSGVDQYSVRDDLGNAVTLERIPRRIVSLAPSITETLFALGLDSAIVGVTDHCDYPPDARKKQHVGGMANPSLESIVALSPDLVVMSVSGNIRGDYDRLRELGITVFVSNPRSVDHVLKSVRDLGALTGKQEKADSVVRDLEAEQTLLVQRAAQSARKRVLLLISIQPIIGVGPGTFLDELLRLANAVNVVQNTPTAYPMLSREEILRQRPEVILVTDDLRMGVERITGHYPEWRKLPAVRNKNVRFVDTNLISRPGPRIMRGLEELMNAIHLR